MMKAVGLRRGLKSRGHPLARVASLREDPFFKTQRNSHVFDAMFCQNIWSQLEEDLKARSRIEEGMLVWEDV